MHSSGLRSIELYCSPTNHNHHHNHISPPYPTRKSIAKGVTDRGISLAILMTSSGSNHHIFNILTSVGIVEERVANQHVCIHKLGNRVWSDNHNVRLYNSRDNTLVGKVNSYELMSKLYTKSRRSWIGMTSQQIE